MCRIIQTELKLVWKHKNPLSFQRNRNKNNNAKSTVGPKI